MFNNCWVAGGGECLGYACHGGILMTMTSYTKRCTKTWRVCWCKFGRNPTKSFCVICILLSLSLIPRQGLFLDFACLFIYSFLNCLFVSPYMKMLRHYLPLDHPHGHNHLYSQSTDWSWFLQTYPRVRIFTYSPRTGTRSKCLPNPWTVTLTVEPIHHRRLQHAVGFFFLTTTNK